MSLDQQQQLELDRQHAVEHVFEVEHHDFPGLPLDQDVPRIEVAVQRSGRPRRRESI